MSLTFHSVLRKFYREPSRGASYQIAVHLATQFQRRFFRNQPIRNKYCLWRLCLLMNPAEMSNLYRGPSKDASYQVSVHLAKRFQRGRFFRTHPIRNKYCLWWPCFLTKRAEMSNRYKGSSIDASYQVSIHLAMCFQRGTFFSNWPIRNKNCLWWPCLLTDWDERALFIKDLT